MPLFRIHKKFLFPILFFHLIFLYSCSSKKVVSVPKEIIPDSTQTRIDTSLTYIERDMRVLILNELKPQSLRFNIPVDVYTADKKFLLKKLQKINFSIEGNDITAGYDNTSIKGTTIEIAPHNPDELINHNKRKYNGIFRFIIYQNKISIVNVLSLNDYVSSVVASELGNAVNKNDIEMIKAFSICVRNYSVLRQKEEGEHFDVHGDIRDQVYYGTDYIKPYFIEASTITNRMFLLSRNNFANIFYFSYCGGSTEDCGNVFPEDISYLKAINDGDPPNCSIIKNFTWEETFTSGEIIKCLQDAGYISGKSELIGVTINGRFASERIKELVFDVNVNGSYKSITVESNNIRYVLKNKSGAILKSTIFDIAVLNEAGKLLKVKFSGKGNGHGVGLCQWGAIGLSRKGNKYPEILNYYFPQLTIEKLN